MIKALRKKFVIVTMLLMVIVFGILASSYYGYNYYWNNAETSLMLDWMAESGVFTSETYDVEKEKLVLDISENENPIIGLILSSTGQIISKKVIGESSSITIPEDTLETILMNGRSSYKAGKYIYSYNTLPDDKILVIAMDPTFYGYNMYKILSGLGIIFLGLAILLLITFILSNFVTEPAKQALLREKQFISDASHELKTPLGAISINAQALATEVNDTIHIKNIISESQRMGRLIENLLILSRLDEKNDIPMSQFSLTDVCEEMILTYESAAYEKHIKYSYTIEPDITIKGNEDEIKQLIAILIDNALKNTTSMGQITANCMKRNNKVILKISNTGNGISEEDLPHVFERFYTSDHSRENKSFGLGLAIAHSIMMRHGGNISVESSPGEKTVFTVSF